VLAQWEVTPSNKDNLETKIDLELPTVLVEAMLVLQFETSLSHHPKEFKTIVLLRIKLKLLSLVKISLSKFSLR